MTDSRELPELIVCMWCQRIARVRLSMQTCCDAECAHNAGAVGEALQHETLDRLARAKGQPG